MPKFSADFHWFQVCGDVLKPAHLLTFPSPMYFLCFKWLCMVAEGGWCTAVVLRHGGAWWGRGGGSPGPGPLACPMHQPCPPLPSSIYCLQLGHLATCTDWVVEVQLAKYNFGCTCEGYLYFNLIVLIYGWTFWKNKKPESQTRFFFYMSEIKLLDVGYFFIFLCCLWICLLYPSFQAKLKRLNVGYLNTSVRVFCWQYHENNLS